MPKSGSSKTATPAATVRVLPAKKITTLAKKSEEKPRYVIAGQKEEWTRFYIIKEVYRSTSVGKYPLFYQVMYIPTEEIISQHLKAETAVAFARSYAARVDKILIEGLN